MTYYETIEAMIEIEESLMRLANNAQGNARLWDAILAAQLVLHNAIYEDEGAA